MINVAMLSFWHVHADDYKNTALKHPKVKIVGVWDELTDRGNAKAKELEAPFYSNLDEILNNPDIQGVIVDCPTNIHNDVITRAVKAKKHIFTEKVITPNFETASKIASLVEESKISFTVSLPRMNDWYTQAILEQIQKGKVGRITSTVVRLVHNGSLSTKENPRGWLPEHFYNLEQCCGGALMDLGCHPVYLTRVFHGGMPQYAYSAFSYVTGKDVEDSSTTIFQFENGATGVAEAGFVNSCSPFAIEIHGTEGFISYSQYNDEITIRSIHNEGVTHVVMRPSDYKGKLTSDFDQWVENIEANSNAKSNICLGVELSKMMEACYSSQKSGKKTRV